MLCQPLQLLQFAEQQWLRDFARSELASAAKGELAMHGSDAGENVLGIQLPEVPQCPKLVGQRKQQVVGQGEGKPQPGALDSALLIHHVEGHRQGCSPIGSRNSWPDCPATKTAQPPLE